MQLNQVTEIDGKVTFHDANKPPTARAQEAPSHTGKWWHGSPSWEGLCVPLTDHKNRKLSGTDHGSELSQSCAATSSHSLNTKAELFFWRPEGPLWAVVPLPSASDTTGFQQVTLALHSATSAETHAFISENITVTNFLHYYSNSISRNYPLQTKQHHKVIQGEKIFYFITLLRTRLLSLSQHCSGIPSCYQSTIGSASF